MRIGIFLKFPLQLRNPIINKVNTSLTFIIIEYYRTQLLQIMAIIRVVTNFNSLPLLLYLENFFTEYAEYYLNEKSRLSNEINENKLQSALNHLLISHVQSAIDRINFNLYDLDIIRNCTKLLRFVDNEMTIMKLEIRKILEDDNVNASEVSLFQRDQEKLVNDIKKLELEKEYWKVLFRMRNIQLFGEESMQQMKLSTNQEDELQEEPSNPMKPIMTICNDFLQDNRFELAEAFITDHLTNLIRKDNKKNLNVAFLYAMLGKIFSKKQDYVKAVNNFKECLTLREQLLPKDHRDIGTIQYNYSLVLINNMQYDQAEMLLNSAMEINLKQLEKDHMTIAMIFNLLGKLNDLKNKVETAVKYYSNAVSVLEKISETFSPLYLHISVAICRNFVNLQNVKNADVQLEKVFRLIQTKLVMDTDKKDSCFTYLKKHANEVTGDNLLHLYGSVEEYDILDLLEILVKYFKNNNKISDAIETWKSLSCQVS